MPTIVTTTIKAASHVIEALLNEEGFIDFNRIAPFLGPHRGFSLVDGGALRAAARACNIPYHRNSLVSALQQLGRDIVDIRQLDDSAFRQFVQLVENYRACGYLDELDFARQEWGAGLCSKQRAEPSTGECRFKTTWSCPLRLLERLSARFPNDEIRVSYEDDLNDDSRVELVIKGGMHSKVQRFAETANAQ